MIGDGDCLAQLMLSKVAHSIVVIQPPQPETSLLQPCRLWPIRPTIHPAQRAFYQHAGRTRAKKALLPETFVDTAAQTTSAPYYWVKK